MKWLLAIVMFVICTPGISQEQASLKKSRNKKFHQNISPELLAVELTGSLSTDAEKVKAIFYWITDNIAYRTQPNITRRKRDLPLIDEASDTAELKPLDERVALTVLEDRVAVCDGYARLFKTLCSYSGIQAEVIHGYARTEAGKRIQRFRPNHSWNAVLIDSVWHLLDVTWASGYISWRGNEFVRQLDLQYFLSKPEQFIREHYPDDLRWALMDDPPLMSEFRHSPFKQKSFSKYQITTYSPQTGVIEAGQGDTVSITLETSDAYKDSRVSSDPFLDTTIYNTSTTTLLVPSISGRTIHYTYVANSLLVQWIYILYNDDIILRYRLKVKATESPVLAIGTLN
ncbi:MAG TPA: transglutaminase domain-containing protein [Chitinophagaceae bacterium]|nr:transglutaminase domain-containing protein [Chitinophagaceae bacterium]